MNNLYLVTLEEDILKDRALVRIEANCLSYHVSHSDCQQGSILEILMQYTALTPSCLFLSAC